MPLQPHTPPAAGAGTGGRPACYGGSAQHAQFFQDSFATPTIPAQYQTLAAGSPLGPWTVGGAGIDRIGGYWQPADGDGASIDLNGSAPGAVSVALSSLPGWTPGATYRLSFSLAGNPDAIIYSPGSTQACVRANTASSTQDYCFDVSNIDGLGTDATRMAMGWRRLSFEFTGAVSDTLTFTSLDPPGDAWGPAKVIQGPKLLAASAEDAARRWRFAAGSGETELPVVFVYRISAKGAQDAELATRFRPPNRIEIRRVIPEASTNRDPAPDPPRRRVK